MDMEIFDIIRGNEVVLCVAIFMTALTLYGHYRGLMRMLLSAASIIIALILADSLLPYTRSILIREGLFDGITESLGRGLSNSLSSTGLMEHGELYELIGADRLMEAAAASIGGVILNIICFIILFILIRILLRIIVRVFDLITALPVVSGLNQLGGAALGFAEAVIYVWIAMAIAVLTPDFWLSSMVLEQSMTNSFLSFIFENNLILGVLLSIFGL